MDSKALNSNRFRKLVSDIKQDFFSTSLKDLNARHLRPILIILIIAVGISFFTVWQINKKFKSGRIAEIFDTETPYASPSQAPPPGTCYYPEACPENTGIRRCTGTTQEGVCKYDPSVNPNCTACETCGNGDCDYGEGPDNCPQDCRAGSSPPPPDSNPSPSSGASSPSPSASSCITTNPPIHPQEPTPGAGEAYSGQEVLSYHKGGAEYIFQSLLDFNGHTTYARSCNVDPKNGIQWNSCTAWQQTDKSNLRGVGNEKYRGITGTTIIKNGQKWVSQAIMDWNGQNSWTRQCPVDPTNGIQWDSCTNSWSAVDATKLRGVCNEAYTSQEFFSYHKGGIEYIFQSLLDLDGHTSYTRTCNVNSANGTLWNNCTTWQQSDKVNLRGVGNEKYRDISGTVFIKNSQEWVVQTLIAWNGQDGWSRQCPIDATSGPQFNSCTAWSYIDMRVIRKSGDNLALNLKLKLSGVPANDNDHCGSDYCNLPNANRQKDVRVYLEKPDGTRLSGNGVENGWLYFVYNSTTKTFDATVNFTKTTLGGSYNLLIKGFAHRQMRFCDTDGSHSTCNRGTNFTLNQDTTTFNLAKRPLEFGDVDQSGSVTVADYSFVKGCKEKDARIGSDDYKNGCYKADGDLNGVVDSSDITLLYTTISTKPDDD